MHMKRLYLLSTFLLLAVLQMIVIAQPLYQSAPENFKTPAGKKQSHRAAAVIHQPLKLWVKRSPLRHTPPSPNLAHEGSSVWDNHHRVMIRYGGHNPGGGGEQHSELWTFDPLTAKWTLKEPNTSPPGACCNQQNVFDPVQGRFIRFPAFSGSHGWQWGREIYLNDSAAWNYDLATNTWRNRRPLPSVDIKAMRSTSWDDEYQVVVLFGGEGSKEGTLVYDPYTNTWTRMNPAQQPDFRSGGSMAYDAVGGRHILFGSQFSNDAHTWAYDLRRNQWHDLKPPVMPPTDRNDAVLAYDSINRIVLALMRVYETRNGEEQAHLETWAYDPGANLWQRMNPLREPDLSGNRARQLMFVPELNLMLLENRGLLPQSDHLEQQIWSYRFAQAQPNVKALPLAPTDLQVITSTNGATLYWQASPSPRVTRYQIFRGKGATPWQVEYEKIAEVEAKQTSYHDAGLEPGTLYFYTMRAVTADQRVSPQSLKARTQPRIVEDVIASVKSAKEVELSWTLSQGKDLVGYHIERAVVEVFSEDQLVRLKTDTPPLNEPGVGAIKAISQFSRLTTTPVTQPRFTDRALDLTKPQSVEGEALFTHRFREKHLDLKGKPYRYAVYAYRIQAVNALGVASGASSFVLTIPSAPQWVFAQEKGMRCLLKWAANPEAGIKGYRVYRIEGPRINGFGQAVSRLTEQSIAAVNYSDLNEDEETRRYHVTAVDALGQEGLPSSPVWYGREWKRYYLPFTSAWHQ